MNKRKYHIVPFIYGEKLSWLPFPLPILDILGCKHSTFFLLQKSIVWYLLILLMYVVIICFKHVLVNVTLSHLRSKGTIGQYTGISHFLLVRAL